MLKSLLSSQPSSSICTQTSLLTELDNYCTSFPFSFSPHPPSLSSCPFYPVSPSAIIFSFFLPSPFPLTPPLIMLSLALFSFLHTWSCWGFVTYRTSDNENHLCNLSTLPCKMGTSPLLYSFQIVL